ncbi:hypothetical protein BS17DRAFT_769224 [Gyrodon lividus]|nr:hypothetical protein BS17DRAFT_769224 [Gyrodon lividus]
MIAICILIAFLAWLTYCLATFILSQHFLFRLDVKGHFIRIIWTNPDNTLYMEDERRTQGPNNRRTKGTWVPEDNNWNGPPDDGGWEEQDGWSQHVATTLEEEADRRLAQFIEAGQAFGILREGFGNEVPNQEPTGDTDSILVDE